MDSRVEEVDTRRFVRSAFVLLKAPRCLHRDSGNPKPKRPDLLKASTSLESLLRPVLHDCASSSAAQMHVVPPSSTQTSLAHSGQMPTSLRSIAGEAFTRKNPILREELRRTMAPPIGMNRAPSLVKERIASLVDPSQSYFAKWELMRDKRDERELSVIRRKARHGLIRDVSLASFLEEKANLNRGLRNLNERADSEKKSRYERNKQREAMTKQNIARMKADMQRGKIENASAQRESVRSVGRMHRLMHLQENEEAMAAGEASHVRLKEFTSSMVTTPKALADRLKNSKRYDMP